MCSVHRIICCIQLHILFSVQGQKIVKIGAIFSENNTGLDERVFRFAVNSIKIPNVKLDPVVKFAATNNLFENIYRTNQLVSEGVIAIVSPKTSTAVKAVYPLCSKFHIPLISASATDSEFDLKKKEYLLRMSPSDNTMKFALRMLIKHHKWNRMGILTSSTYYGMNSLLDFKEFVAITDNWEILATEHFLIKDGESGVNATKNLLKLREQGARVILLSCLAKYVPHVLAQAEKLDMMAKGWAWILTDEAISTDTSIRYREGLVGVSVPMMGSGTLYKEVSEAWQNTGETKPLSGRAGRIYDAVRTIVNATEKLLARNESIALPTVKNGLCPSLKEKPWDGGSLFLSDLKSVRTQGIMNTIRFTPTGSPYYSIYDIVNYQHDEGWVKVGDYGQQREIRWKMNRKKPIVWPNGTLNTPTLASVELKYMKIKVLIALSPPFVMKKEDSSDHDGGGAYEGFCIDLLNELRGKLHFEYELQLRKEIGAKKPDGTWGGMIGELTRKKATLAVSTLTISPEREKAVDFTQPYFNLGFKIIMKKTNMDDKMNTWGFLDPFEKTLWLAIIGSSVIIGIVVCVYDGWSPYGFYGKVLQSKEVISTEIHAQNTLSFLNSIWAAATSYMEQGPDRLHPVSSSGRATTLAWWFAISIFGATYTANLAAFLTINKYETPIKTIEDLANQDRIKYGIAPGQLAEMLKSASLPVYEKLWKYKTMEPNSSFAIEKVRRTENYAFIWDSAVLEYETQREPCNTLKLIERPFGNINYGFALPRNSPYTNKFSVAMLELQQEGFLERMTEKWFRSRSACSAETQAAQATAEEGGDQLRFIDMAGVFITLAVGVVAGVVILFFELIYASFKDAKCKEATAPKTTCEALMKRLHQTRKRYQVFKGLSNEASNSGERFSLNAGDVNNQHSSLLG